MPTSEIGKAMRTLKAIDSGQRRHADAGFSLTELMIVVFIIGIVSSFILMTAMPQNSDLEQRVEDVKRLLEQSAQEAVISGQPQGAEVSAREVQLVRLVEGNWTPIAEARVRLPLDIQMTYQGDGAARADGAPDIIFDPIGTASTARLIFIDDGSELILTVNEGAATRVEAFNGRG